MNKVSVQSGKVRTFINVEVHVSLQNTGHGMRLYVSDVEVAVCTLDPPQ